MLSAPIFGAIPSHFRATLLQMDRTAEVKVPVQQRQMRTDIQFLRAVSIILVILYHLKIPLFQGGFIGVDVFFVISGFLVSGPQIEELCKATSYSHLNFMARRVKRLSVTSFVCLLFVLVCLTFAPFVTNQFNDVAAAALNVLNIHFYKQTGLYDSPDQESNFVLHFWSLSLEWQFYFFSPILLIFLRKIATSMNWELQKSMKTFLIGISVFSFFLCFNVSDGGKFYLFPTRLWEFFLGALIYLIQKENSSNFQFFSSISPLALLGIFVCGIFIKFNSYPNFWTLLVTTLTSIIILGNSKNFDGKLMILIGDWSYSLYLYHWPIIKYGEQLISFHNLNLGFFFAPAMIFFIVIFGLTSFYFVEYYSSKINFTQKKWMVFFLIMSLTIASVSVNIQNNLANSSKTSLYESLFFGIPRTPKTEFFRPNVDSIVNSTISTKPYCFWKKNHSLSAQELISLRKNVVAQEHIIYFPNTKFEQENRYHIEHKSRRNVVLFDSAKILPSKRCVLLVGDSHAAHYHASVHLLANQTNSHFYRICRACPQNERDATGCFLSIDPKISYVDTPPLSFFENCTSLITFTASYFKHPFNKTYTELYKKHIQTILQFYSKFGQVVYFVEPRYTVMPLPCLRDTPNPEKSCASTLEEMFTGHNTTEIYNFPGNVNVTHFNAFENLVDEKGWVYAYDGEIPVFWDNQPHFTEIFAINAAPLFAEKFKENRGYHNWVKTFK